MNPPGHNYLGPGNRTNNGPPRDRDDAIAQTHDIAYSRAATETDIRAADRQAIAAFSRDFIQGGNWHSAAGAVGLGTKYVVESAVGVQYPSMSGKMCTHKKVLKNLVCLAITICLRIILKEIQVLYLTED